MTIFDLNRFIAAQDHEGHGRVVAQLRAGAKTSHWMWFVFPQLAGLGTSEKSNYFGIVSLDEAKAYLRNNVLRERLLECTRLVADCAASSATEIFGPIDSQKLRSSMTLFMRAAPNESVFRQVLDRFYGGVSDPATDVKLSEWSKD